MNRFPNGIEVKMVTKQRWKTNELHKMGLLFLHSQHSLIIEGASQFTEAADLQSSFFFFSHSVCRNTLQLIFTENDWLTASFRRRVCRKYMAQDKVCEYLKAKSCTRTSITRICSYCCAAVSDLDQTHWCGAGPGALHSGCTLPLRRGRSNTGSTLTALQLYVHVSKSSSQVDGVCSDL